MHPTFSFFRHPIRNAYPSRRLTLGECFQLIKLPYPYGEPTAKLRNLTTPTERRQFKAENLDYVTFSGIFSHRADKSLLIHSGLIAIDLDHLSDIIQTKETIRSDHTLEPAMVFTSPSGDGLKVIIPVNMERGLHSDYFDSISLYLLITYGLTADPSGRDVSRACFLCHDPQIYINAEYNDWR
jgi:hypothetical protein